MTVLTLTPYILTSSVCRENIKEVDGIHGWIFTVWFASESSTDLHRTASYSLDISHAAMFVHSD